MCVYTMRHAMHLVQSSVKDEIAIPALNHWFNIFIFDEVLWRMTKLAKDILLNWQVDFSQWWCPILNSQSFCRSWISDAQCRMFSQVTNCLLILTMCYAHMLKVLLQWVIQAPPIGMQSGWNSFADWSMNNAKRCRKASPSLDVITVTVKIQIGRMTMIDLGDREEVFWGRFWKQWATNSDPASQETPLNICRLAIGHCEVNRGQWPQVTWFGLETLMMQGQRSQLVMYWHQSHQLSPFKSIALRLL